MTIYFEKLHPGKLPHDFLQELLSDHTRRDERVMVGAAVGEDATVIDMGDRYLLAKTDPITFVTDHLGYYGVHVNANDIYCMGGTPKWFLATLLLPEIGTSREMVQNIFQQINQACRMEQIIYCGGHTEITMGLNRPILVGQMLGEVEKDKLLHKKLIREGDKIILAKPVPIEATAIISREKEQEIKQAFSDDFLQRCQGILRDPGLGVGVAARTAHQAGQVHSLHDITEGGLATALHEISRAAGLGLQVRYDDIPFLPEGKLLCDHFGLDPLGCIGSGSLLVFCAKDSLNSILNALEKAEIPSACIGNMLGPEDGVGIAYGDDPFQRLPVFNRDEVIKILSL
jgi:hydrogenase expression/formation protein HypE